METVVIEAINSYWKEKSRDRIGEWHLFKTSVLEKLKTYQENSEVLDRILSRRNNLPFINRFIKCSLIFHCVYMHNISYTFFNFD